MTVKIKTFSPGHLSHLTLRPEQKASLKGVMNEQYGRLMATHSSVAMSAFINTRCVACWGLLPLWDGVADAWMLVSLDIRLAALAVTKNVSQILDAALEHRVQTSVLADFEQGHRFAKSLGFCSEGLMRQYDNLGRDHVRYARIKSWLK